jgi:4-alpha-glucanotransferase
VRFIGDIPIFVAHDSADVWRHRELFDLDARARPREVAGVPPDYFSKTGQRWGNPLYRWDEMEREGFAWWRRRVRAVLRLVDVVRVDHFRGLEAFYAIPAGAPDATRGRWVKAPGERLLRALRADLGSLPFIAEDLGVITPEVLRLRDDFGLPGMRILQFAFSGDDGADPFLPHNYVPHTVAYTGTHDNDTTLGWYRGSPGDLRPPARVAREAERARRYLHSDGREVHWDFVRGVQASVARTAVVPLQDALGLGSEARFNRPAVAEGNWSWRVPAAALDRALAERLADLCRLYGR